MLPVHTSTSKIYNLTNFQIAKILEYQINFSCFKFLNLWEKFHVQINTDDLKNSICQQIFFQSESKNVVDFFAIPLLLCFNAFCAFCVFSSLLLFWVSRNQEFSDFTVVMWKNSRTTKWRNNGAAEFILYNSLPLDTLKD